LTTYGIDHIGLFFPLEAIIDYLGFRVFAMVALNQKENLVYGSPDSGITFVHSDQQMNKLMEAVASELNLKASHRTRKGELVDGPANVDGYLCPDKRRYITGLSKLMPPEDTTLLK